MAEKSDKTDKVVLRRKKFVDLEVPLTKSKMEIIGNSPKELKDKTIKLDLTRQLKGKSVEVTFRVKIENEKAIAYPIKIKLMPYFIRRMIRKRISYVEDSFEVPSQESMFVIKPFLITKRRVSRAVRKTLRNKAKNWIGDYVAERNDHELFSEVLSNKMQRPLSLMLKKTYPLSLCEIRIFELKRALKPEEIPKIMPKEKKEERVSKKTEELEFIDQIKEIEDEKIRQAEKDIAEVQMKAVEMQNVAENKEIDEGDKEMAEGDKVIDEGDKLTVEEAKEESEKPKIKVKKTRKKKEE